MIRVAHPYMLLLLGVMPAFIWGIVWGDRKRRSAQERFASSAPRQIDFSRRRWKRVCLLAAAVSLILALSQPVWKGPADLGQESSGDVVFMLDVSRSMLSVDALPTRLARAKHIITSLTRQFQGERIALVTFAGVPAVQCPLTTDGTFFHTMLELASPESVARGGTRIGDAIRFSLDSVFDDVVRTRKLLVIVTDGGDQDSTPAVAARTAVRRSIKLLVIGIGDEINGALVPTSESDLTPILYHGKEVHTKLEQGILQTIATAGGGAYLNAGNGELDTAVIYRQFVAPASSPPSRDEEKSASSWLVLFAIALLMVEFLLSDRTARSATLAVILIANISAQTPEEWVSKGNIAFRDSQWSQALDNYERAARSTPVLPQLYFNIGIALYRMGRYTSASDAFARAAAASRGTPLEAESKFGQANCAYRQAINEPPLRAQQLLRRVLSNYDELSAIPDARFNADIARRRLSDLQKRQSKDAPATPSANKRAFDPRDIVQQGKVPAAAQRQSVDTDW